MVQIEGENLLDNNSNYIKFYDGTLITKQVKTVTTTIDGVWGNIYISGNIILDNYPITFVEKPTVSIYVESSNSAFIINAGVGSISKPSPINLCRGQALSSSNTYDIHVIAIGRWK